MNVRPRALPPGWYPQTEEATRRKIEQFLQDSPEVEGVARAGIAPHAGWEFSGKTALEVFLNLKKEVETVVVVGGHLYPSEGIIAAFEDGYETPLGVLPADRALLERLSEEIALREDRQPDNTVEVQLPFVRYLFPDSRALALRAAPSTGALGLGRAIKNAAEKVGRSVVVVGSTDLTHYGDGYGFSPEGKGEQAVEWVREVNDRGFIESLLAMDGERALVHAQRHHSACSAGGAVAALAFAGESGCREGKLLDYLTSYDICPSDSFVGYAGIIFV